MWIPRVRRQGVALLVAVAAWGFAIVGFELMRDGLFFAGLLFIDLAQGADTVSAIFRHTILLTIVPDELRGRLTSIAQMFFLGGPCLGQVESGIAADAVSPEFSVISGGMATVACVGLVALWRRSSSPIVLRRPNVTVLAAAHERTQVREREEAERCGGGDAYHQDRAPCREPVAGAI